MKILALDIGDKRIGVATCDELGMTVHGITVIERRNRDKDLQELQKLVLLHNPKLIVVGIPLTDRNTVSEQGKKIMRFTERLRKKLKIPVKTWDERYSSREAAEILTQRGESTDDQIDRVSASIILKRFMEENRGKI